MPSPPPSALARGGAQPSTATACPDVRASDLVLTQLIPGAPIGGDDDAAASTVNLGCDEIGLRLPPVRLSCMQGATLSLLWITPTSPGTALSSLGRRAQNQLCTKNGSIHELCNTATDEAINRGAILPDRAPDGRCRG